MATKKMLFYLTTMNLANIIIEDVPKATTDPPTKEMLLTIEAWTQSDFLCIELYFQSSRKQLK